MQSRRYRCRGLEKRRTESFEIYLKFAEEQAERINEQSEIRLFFKGLSYLLDTNEATIAKLKAREIGYDAKDSREAIGFHKGGFIFLKKEYAFHQVASYYKRYGRDFPIEEATLRKQLYDNGFLAVTSSKERLRRLKVGNESYVCMKFEEKVFNMLKGEVRSGEEQEVSDNRGACKATSRFV